MPVLAMLEIAREVISDCARNQAFENQLFVDV